MTNRRPQIGRRTTAVVLLVAALAAAADEPAGPDAQKVLDAQIARLASDSWKQRKEATEALVALGEIALPRLRQLAEQTDDGEVRARAAAAVARIEEAGRIGMTRLTLRLDDVPARDAVAEIARQARAPIPTDPPDLLTGKSSPAVSLRADRRPYWDLMQDLCRQTGLEVTLVTRQNREIGLGLARGTAEWMDKPIALGGPLLIRADHLERTSGLHLKPPLAASGDFSISLTVFAEPKLKVLDYSDVLKLEEAVDDQGNSLIPPDANDLAANVDTFGNGRDGPTSRWGVSAGLHYPKNPGTKITRLRASVNCQVQTRAATLEAPVAGARNVSRTVEGLRVVIKSIDANRCEVSAFRDARDDAEWYAVRMQLFAGDARLVDASGRVVARAAGAPDSDEGADGQRVDLRFRFTRDGVGDGSSKEKEGPRPSAAAEAHRFVWEIPVESRRLVVPFEFRDLPMPR
jgi:hypothetical protein